MQGNRWQLSVPLPSMRPLLLRLQPSLWMGREMHWLPQPNIPFSLLLRLLCRHSSLCSGSAAAKFTVFLIYTILLNLWTTFLARTVTKQQFSSCREWYRRTALWYTPLAYASNYCQRRSAKQPSLIGSHQTDLLRLCLWVWVVSAGKR